MSAPSSSGLYQFSHVQHPGFFVKIEVTGAGPAGAAIQTRLMELAREAITSHMPGTFPRGPADDGVASVYNMSNQEAAHRREPPMEEHAPKTYVCDMRGFISIRLTFVIG